MFFRVFSTIITVFILTLSYSCVSQRSTYNHSTYSNKRPIDSYIAENHIKKQEYNEAVRRLEYCLDTDLGVEKHVKMFKQDYPHTLPYIFIYYKDKIQKANSYIHFREFESLLKKMRMMNKFELMSDNDFQKLFDELEEVVVSQNTNNSLKIFLTENYLAFPKLKKPKQKSIIYRRSVDELVGKRHSPLGLQKEIIEHLKQLGKDSQDYKYLQKNLSKINFSEKIIKNELTEIFPDFCNNWIEAHTAKLKLSKSLESDDPYLFEIEQELLKNDNIIISDTNDDDVFTIEIQKIRFSERYLPERTQTIRYATHQVNLLGAVLLMPKNATYLYDVISGGYEIAYTFSLKILQSNQKILEKRINGKKSDRYEYCSDPRIRNVFGGVSPAEFIANNDMQARCGLDRRNVNEEEVFSDVIKDVAYEILNLDPIKSRIE